MNKMLKFIVAALLVVGAFAAPASAAFDFAKLTKKSAGIDQGPAIFAYDDSATALATLVAANYMANTPQVLEVGDLLYVYASDGSGLYAVTVASTTTSTLVALNDATSTFSACVESTVVFDPAATTFGSVEEKDVTATGAALGDTCQVSAPYDLTNKVFAECYVDTADSALINLHQPGIILRGSESYNASNVDAAAMTANDVTVTGAALGDPAYCTMSIDIVDLTLSASVTATDTVTTVLHNGTGAAVDLGAATVTCAVEDVSASAVDLASGTWNVRTCTPVP